MPPTYLLDDDGHDVGVSHREYLEAAKDHCAAEIRRQGASAELSDGYEVPPLTSEDIDRAAEVVAMIAAIPSLSAGVVGFGLGLVGGHWYRDRAACLQCDERIAVSIPQSPDLDNCRAAVRQDINAARVEALEFIHASESEDERACFELDARALEIAEVA